MAYKNIYILWFKFILGLNFIFFCVKIIIIHYHTQKQTKKTKKIKLRIKLNHNMYIICKNLIYSCRGTETLFRSENAGFGKLIINYTLI